MEEILLLVRWWRVQKVATFLPSLTLAMLPVVMACAPATQHTSAREMHESTVIESPASFSFVPRASSLPNVATPFFASPEVIPLKTLTSKCNEQRAQSFLMRSTYISRRGLTPDALAHRKKLHHTAIEYRTRHYGLVEGFGDLLMNSRPPYDYTSEARFFGLNIRMNSKVLVALGCVEETIQQTCTNAPYTPKMIDGLRTRNTFHNNEVSNHLYGIAIDIDPDRNACCYCVAPSKDAPICRKPAKTPFDHAEIPSCWVDAFERYGFYWLGRDELEDTMHFEFLGDPDKIKATQTTGN